MAIDEQVALLKQGARAWNAWRASKPQAAVDLSHGALRGLALKGVDLSGADLTAADLRSVQFLQCPQLEAAHNWQSAYRDENLACGAATPVR